jgi:hypothetical protein
MPSPDSTIFLRLPSDLKERIQEDCDAFRVSVNQIGVRLFEAWVNGEIKVFLGKNDNPKYIVEDVDIDDED